MGRTYRRVYRSAIYYISAGQKDKAIQAIENLKDGFSHPIITRVVPFKTFELNQKTFLNYHQKNPDTPFCNTYISPKLSLLMQKFGKHVKVR
ncbi:hypothetical protein EZ449_15485 [Pedobacter frigidisoli]|uniref:peptide-methionine (S)-S-oxide reductase n=1 Tax=Pedobacter frigidisoli TaxID=2530455 RepID=A0A4R0NW72_9SPHI|nr:hypothetical protein EZ449_15485 [Pedobacter frigidisoli]